MKHAPPFLVALLVVFLCRASAFAEQAEPKGADAEDVGELEDIENATTPRSLAELLPKDDKDWPEPFWLIAEMNRRTEMLSMGWSIKREDKDIVIGLVVAEGGREKSSSALTYTADGKLKGYRMVQAWRSSTKTIEGKVVGENLELTVTRDDHEGDIKKTESIPLKDFEQGTLLHWSPLVAAYHIRKGNLGYKVGMIFEPEDARVEAVLHVEDAGTEMVEHQGEQVEAHVLIIRAFDPDRRDGEAVDESRVVQMTMTFLKDGGFFAMHMKQGEMAVTAKLATQEEVIEAEGEVEKKEEKKDAVPEKEGEAKDAEKG